MMSQPDAEQYDAIVIGSGQGGGPIATALAQAGRKTALIESTHLGGTCVNEGCTPTKTMVASARVAYLARRGPEYGVETGRIGIDQKRIRKRTHAVVDSFRTGAENRTKAIDGLDLIMGMARFSGAKTLSIALNGGGNRTLTAETIIIDVGTRPAIPNLPGLDGVPYLTSTSILDLRDTPQHLVILGAGPIALEFAQMFHRFGSDVTVVNRSPSILPKEDPEIAEAMQAILEEDGVRFLHRAQASRVSTKNDELRFDVDVAGESNRLRGSHLLVATGRTPNTDILDPAAASIALDVRGFIPVNTRLRTNVKGIYAIGDVNGGPAFTHISYDDFRVLRESLVRGGQASTQRRPVPWCIFTDPELGRVGLTEREAKAQGKQVKVAMLPMTSVARAIESAETRGLMKAVVDASSGKILGAAVLGIGGGELMTMIQLAMQGGLTAADLAHGVFAHPTLAESLNNLFSQITG
jgi:pyruvate/2-oxoglutarate dehydrogenase complex dihydrolipoamide dehydrogenase (E3) component